MTNSYIIKKLTNNFINDCKLAQQTTHTNLWIDSHYGVAVDVLGIPRAFQKTTLIRYQEVWPKKSESIA